MVWANAERFGGTIGFRRRVDGSWVDVTTREFAAQVLDVAKGMIAAGLRPGDRIALLSGTRYEWSLFDFAGLAIGCQIVPVDATASAAEVEWILADSGACAVVVETAAHRETVRAVVDRLPEIVWVWQLDGGVQSDGEVVADAVDELTALAAEAGWVSDDTVHQRRLAVRTDDIATVVYPPGAERGKRAELTHGELLADVRTAIAAFPALLRPGNSLLLLLALADLPARVIAMCCVYTRTTLGHLPEAGDLFTDLGVFRPRVIVADTALLREVYESARSRGTRGGRHVPVRRGRVGGQVLRRGLGVAGASAQARGRRAGGVPEAACRFRGTLRRGDHVRCAARRRSGELLPRHRRGRARTGTPAGLTARAPVVPIRAAALAVPARPDGW